MCSLDLQRPDHTGAVLRLLDHSPVVAVLGARQVGKTTLSRLVAGAWDGDIHRFDLEDPRDLARLADPMLALERLEGLVVLDEVQRLPDLFAPLRVLADRQGRPATFLVLGSAGPGLLRQSAETLAGRIAFHELRGVRSSEVGDMERLWLRGGFPRSFLAPNEDESLRWRNDFVRTFLERDLPGLGVRIPAETMRRFWTMLAHYHGQTWNGSELGRSLGVAHTTVRRYLDTLRDALVIDVMPPWFENVGKRLVKSPRVNIADSGILHALLGIRGRVDLERHPKLGASWEGFVINELIAHLGVERRDCWFWRTQAGAELDLLVVRGSERRGYEIKRTSTPRLTRSMRSALDDLRLDSLDVVHAGKDTFPLAPRVRAVALTEMADEIPAF